MGIEERENGQAVALAGPAANSAEPAAVLAESAIASPEPAAAVAEPAAIELRDRVRAADPAEAEGLIYALEMVAPPPARPVKPVLAEPVRAGLNAVPETPVAETVRMPASRDAEIPQIGNDNGNATGNGNGLLGNGARPAIVAEAAPRTIFVSPPVVENKPELPPVPVIIAAPPEPPTLPPPPSAPVTVKAAPEPPAPTPTPTPAQQAAPAPETAKAASAQPVAKAAVAPDSPHDAFLKKTFNQKNLDVHPAHPDGNGFFELAGSGECHNLKTTADVVRLAVAGQRIYSLHLTGYATQGAHDKAAILQFVFLDKHGEPITGVYSFASYSELSKNYCYLPVSEQGKPFELNISTPAEAHALLIGCRLWNPAQPSQVSRRWRFRQESVYLSPADYVNLYARFFETADASPSDTMVFLYASTKPIGHSHRGNRTMRFATLLSQRGIPVLYNYYRWNATTDMIHYEGETLFQSPIDITVRKMGEIATHQYKQKNKIFLLSFPNSDACQYMGLFKENGWKVIYECRDDWEEFWLAGAGKWYDPMFEQYVVANADAVITISCTLRDKMQRWRLPGTRPVALIPNGLEPSFLQKPTAEFIKERKKRYRLKKNRKVVVGYHGHLTPAWFDWPLVIETARSRPQWQFQIIGFDGPEALELPENMEFLGPKSHEEINQIAQDWTVAIIPFIPSRLAEGVDPIKIYEYLAMGLPVVSVLMPQILEYPYTRCYQAREDFARMIEEASREKIEVAVVEEFLGTRTWNDRIDQTLAYARQIEMES